jgi:hypothetical protein
LTFAATAEEETARVPEKATTSASAMRRPGAE